MVQPLWKIVWQFLLLNKHTVHIDSAITLVRIDPTELKTVSVQKPACPTFPAALSMIAKTRKPDVLQQVKNNQVHCATTKQWDIIQLKGNEPSVHEKTKRGLGCIVLRERSPSEKAAHCMVPPLWHSGKGKLRETVKKGQVVGRNGGKEGMTKWGTEDFEGTENTLHDTVMLDTFVQTYRSQE